MVSRLDGYATRADRFPEASDSGQGVGIQIRAFFNKADGVLIERGLGMLRTGFFRARHRVAAHEPRVGHVADHRRLHGADVALDDDGDKAAADLAWSRTVALFKKELA